MANELLWIILLLLNFGAILVLYRFLGKIGLFAWICIGTILANMQVMKVVDLFGFTATLGNITYATIFLATDILSEKHSKKDAFVGTILGFISLVATTAIMQIVLKFQPNGEDWAQPHLAALFDFIPRLALASLIAFAISQTHDVISYHFIKRHLPADKWLWIRNNGSTLVSQMIDTLVFVTIAFYGVYDVTTFWSIFWTTYVIKAVVAICDTPCIYLAKHITPSKLMEN